MFGKQLWKYSAVTVQEGSVIDGGRVSNIIFWVLEISYFFYILPMYIRHNVLDLAWIKKSNILYVVL